MLLYCKTGNAVLGHCSACRHGDLEAIIEDIERKGELITGAWINTCMHRFPSGFFCWKFNLELVLPYLPTTRLPLPSEMPAPPDQRLGWWVSALNPRRDFSVCADQHSSFSSLLTSIISTGRKSVCDRQLKHSWITVQY